MRLLHRFTSRLGLLILLLLGSQAHTVLAAPAVPGNLTFAALARHLYLPGQAALIFVDGPVYFHSLATKKWKAAALNQILLDSDSIRTGPHGYAAISFSTDNLLLLHPNSGVRIKLRESGSPRLTVQVHKGEMLLSVVDSNDVVVEGRQAHLFLQRGEFSLRSTEKEETVRALLESSFVRLTGGVTPLKLPAGYQLTIDAQGRESKPQRFDTIQEYATFRRFRTALENFRGTNAQLSTDIAFRIDSVLVDDIFVSNLSTNEHGYRVINPGSKPAPRTLLFRMKVTPFPRPQDRFEIAITKDLIFPLKEAGNGFLEARIPTPGFPEFHLKVHYVDENDRRAKLYESNFVLSNRRQKIDEIKAFLTELTRRFERRDFLFFREQVSRDYRDWFGNSYFDFIKSLEDSLRNYRDIRLVLRPHSFTFKGDEVLVDLTYRLTALTSGWKMRYDDLGSDLLTLVYRDGSWKLKGKTRGLFLQRLRVANDLRLGILRGQVKDEATGSPVRGAQVRILRTRYSTTTDSMGEYLIHNIAPGTYDIEITKNGFGRLLITQMEIKPSGDRF
ncbi:MAG TPA: carboxypeptidase-like regulatory domain-containing protein [Candidatus Ozemobacteraceae bacterium]|nr:carboxypeptidase-like regulatory domain-containing protein [Candidatus Ozemobacteraceae bacterium]